MIKVYEASNSIEANLLKGVLQNEGIDADIHGEYLQGAVGELPTMGLIQILVDESDRVRAEKLIQDWEQGAYEITEDTDDGN